MQVREIARQKSFHMGIGAASPLQVTYCQDLVYQPASVTAHRFQTMIHMLNKNYKERGVGEDGTVLIGQYKMAFYRVFRKGICSNFN